MKKISMITAAAMLTAGISLSSSANAADENVMIVFDGSNSMWGQIDGTAKIEIARNVMGELLGEWAENRQVGLMAYGHRRRGDCSDIELIVEPGTGTRQEILDRINTITPTGRTPLTSAVEQAAISLSYTDTPATVVLISDGVESCDRDPCALAETLERAGVGFTAHVVGFGLDDADQSALACIAKNTGGQYLSARNAEELGEAFAAVSTAVAEPAPAPKPEPEPEPKYDVTLSAPTTALAGSQFEVSWTGTVSAADFVTIVPMGADEGTRDNHFRVRDKTSDGLRAPSQTGMYEVRYVLDEGSRTLASQPIEITEPEVSVSAPEKVRAGDTIRVSWTGAVSEADFVTIVPMGADEGTRDNHFRVRNKSEDKLSAPEETGLYEIRYVLDEGGRTLARQPIEVLAADAPLQDGASLEAPDSAVPGETIQVAWSAGGSSADQRITLARADQAVFTWITAVKIEGDAPVSLTLPDEPGTYELRFLDIPAQKVLARRIIEVR